MILFNPVKPVVIQVFKLALALSCLLIQAGCRNETTKNDAAVVSGPDTDLPSLYERQGTLAKAPEWPKTKAKVEDLKRRIVRSPKDVKPRLQVAAIYMAEARITGEHPYYYPAILSILDDVLALEPANFEALIYKASVKMSQHQFAEAKAIAGQARQLNPNNAYIYGVLVDANVELGNYEEAVAMSDRMQVLKPSLESYSRASYLREIYGDYPGAIQAMQLAVEAGLPGSEPHCWSKKTLGYLYEQTGKPILAERQYREILAMRPSYAFALHGLARVHKSRKQYDQALTLLDSAARIMPEFSFHEEMAEIYGLRGETVRMREKYRQVITMLSDDARSGHRVDLELCNVYTAAGQLDSARVYGLREYRKRPNNIDVNAALARMYYRSNDFPKAQQHLKVARRTGSKDPELIALARSMEPTRRIAFAK